MFSENFNRSISATANLGVGDVIGGAFGAIRKHWIVFGAYALLLTCLPAAAGRVVVVTAGVNYTSVANTFATLGRALLVYSPSYFLFAPLFHSLVAWTIWADSVQAPNDFRAAVVAVGRRLGPILLLNIAVLIAEYVGMLLLVIPGIIAVLALYTAISACAVEGLSVQEAVRRSLFLTRGQRWRLFLVLLVASLIYWGLSIIINLASMMAGVLINSGSPAAVGVLVLVTGLNALFLTSISGSVYVELLRIKGGGVGAAATAEIFA
ncbi:MAG: hypothetical protein ABSD80_10860 [Caulobacteraceae bacterium]